MRLQIYISFVDDTELREGVTIVDIDRIFFFQPLKECIGEGIVEVEAREGIPLRTDKRCRDTISFYFQHSLPKQMYLALLVAGFHLSACSDDCGCL